MKKLLPLLNSGLFRGLGAISQVVLAAWVTRGLTKAESGEFLFYLTCFTLASPMLLLGTQQFAMRHLSQFAAVDQHATAAAIRLARAHFKTIGLVLLGLLPLAITFDQKWLVLPWSTPLDSKWLIFVVNSLLGSGCLAIAAHYHGIRNLAWSLIFSHIGTPAITVAIFSMFPPTNATDAIWYHGAACLCTLALACSAWLFTFKPYKPHEKILGRLIDVRACIDLWLLNTFILLMNWAPLIISGVWLAAESIAELNIAQRAANLINFLLIVIGFTFAPKFRFAWSQNDLWGLRKMVRKCSLYLIVLGTPLAIVVIAGAPWIMGAFGREYRQGAVLLCIFAAAQYFNVITGTVNQVLTMSNHERMLRNICFVSSLTSIILGAVLTIAFGAIGAALAGAFALILQNVLAVFAVRRVLGYWIFDIRPLRAQPAA